jgi:hypothetical protein
MELCTFLVTKLAFEFIILAPIWLLSFLKYSEGSVSFSYEYLATLFSTSIWCNNSFSVQT